MNEDEVEQHMWKLVLLVRCQDRTRGLRLQRHESQRKLLDLRLYELILLSMRIMFMKEKLISVETTRTGGTLKLKFRDIGKWNGRAGATGSSAGLVDMMMASGIGGGSGTRSDAGLYMKKAAENDDGRNFARISREFERIRAERKLMSSRNSGSAAGRPTKGSILRSKNDGGFLLNPAGHSSLLGAFAADNVF